MAPEPIKCTLKNFGTFSTPTFGGVGEPFNDRFQVEARGQGRQFVTNKQRHGQTGDNWNRGTYGRREPVKRLFEGEKYVEQFKGQQAAEMKERAKNLTTNGFRYPSPNKKSSGLGSYDGCIGPKLKHEPEFNVLTKEDKPGPVVHESRQIICNPPRKGYGSSTPGCIFGPGPLQGELGFGRYGGREYTHSVDPYDLAQKKEQETRKKDAEALQGRPPFKSMAKAVDFFDGHNKTAASKVYTEDPRIPPRPDPPKVGQNMSDRPFFPAAGPKSGPNATFNKFPEYKEDPLDEKMKKAKEEALKAQNVGSVPFKPTSKPFSTPTPSIVFHTAGPKPMC